MALLTPHYFRQRAETCHALALSIDGIMDPGTREILRAIAEEYEAMVAALENHS